MRKPAFLLLLTIIICTALHAQQSSVKGIITDTSSKENLKNATISIIRQKDSILVKYARADNKGSFLINNLTSGKYIVLITYPQYADFADVIELGENTTKDFGTTPLIQKAKLLEEVIVRQKIAAIRIKGDTTEYKADSFKVGANANVQDLLKKMPGIQVNSKGEITTQGEKVEKILVDGEEFFSDDPAVVTQSLRADAVNTVQVFDKKSDQATFSGIDDGSKTKTINLQLKEDKKKGYFGKIEAGSDFNKYSAAKLMANAFKGKRKMAGYFTYDNTKFESLNWQDKNNYGGDLNSSTEFSDDGGIYYYNTGDDFSNSQGLPNAISAGFLFSKKWNKDKHNINNNYQYNNQHVTGVNKTFTQNILSDTSYNTSQEQGFVSDKNRNRIKSVYDWTIDSTSSFKVTLNAGLVHMNNWGTTIGKSTSEDNKIINQSNRYTSNISDDKTMSTNLFYRKRFKKKGRTMSINTDFSLGDKTYNTYLLANNEYYNKSGSLVSQDNIDQYKPNEDNTLAFATKASYTEPVWKNVFLELNYKYALNQSKTSRETFSKSSSGKYDQFIDGLSNHYQYNNNAHTGGFNLRYNGKKLSASLGSGIGTVTYKLTDISGKKDPREIDFTNLLPTANINYNLAKQTRLNFSYNGNTRNPSLQQIQPFTDNIDPLNVTIGNPDLTQEFRNNFRFSFNDYKVLKGRSIYLSANFTTVNNAISNASQIDSVGKRTNKTINVNGTYNGNLYSRISTNVWTILNVGIGFRPGFSRSINYVNGKENMNNTVRMGYSVSMYLNGEQWINFYLGFDANHNKSTSSINEGIVTQYWMYETDGGIEMKLPKKTYLDIDGNITMYQKTAAFANQRDLYIVNATLKKSITKNENWQLKLTANDIFNQNLGINRSISSNFISETSNQTIQRYFMLSLIYNFSKNGKPQN